MALKSSALLFSVVLLFVAIISTNAVPAPEVARVRASTDAPSKRIFSFSLADNNEYLNLVRQANTTDTDEDDNSQETPDSMNDKVDDKTDNKDDNGKDDRMDDKDKDGGKDDNGKDDNGKDDNGKDDNGKDGDDKHGDDKNGDGKNDDGKDSDDKDDDDKRESNTGTIPDSISNPVTAGSEDVCFSGTATVLLENGERKLMSELAVGDRVQVGPNLFSDVFMFTHKLTHIYHHFLTLHTAAGPAISLTASHYIHINGALVTAGAVKVGDYVELSDGSLSRVVEITGGEMKGLYNPQTVHGDIVVDGVRASTYTSSVDPRVAHALLAPFRALFRQFTIATTAGESGGGRFVQYFPRGGIHEAL